MPDPHEIELSVNGRAYTVAVEARTNLADALRHKLGLRGTKVGCEHGVCGACTVLADGQPIRSCIVLAVQAQDWQITTVESLPDYTEGGNRLQQAFSENHALQCGFCTPGFLMLATALDSEPAMTAEQVRDYVSSNICRCTGYRGIVSAVCQVLEPLTDTSVDAKEEGSL